MTDLPQRDALRLARASVTRTRYHLERAGRAASAEVLAEACHTAAAVARVHALLGTRRVMPGRELDAAFGALCPPDALERYVAALAKRHGAPSDELDAALRHARAATRRIRSLRFVHGRTLAWLLADARHALDLAAARVHPGSAGTLADAATAVARLRDRLDAYPDATTDGRHAWLLYDVAETVQHLARVLAEVADGLPLDVRHEVEHAYGDLSQLCNVVRAAHTVAWAGYLRALRPPGDPGWDELGRPPCASDGVAPGLPRIVAARVHCTAGAWSLGRRVAAEQPPRNWVAVELTGTDVTDATLAALAAHVDPDRTLVCAADRRTLRAVRRRLPGLPRCWSLPSPSGRIATIAMRALLPLIAVRAINRGGADAVRCRAAAVTPLLVRLVHAAGGKVLVDAPPQPRWISALLRLGVDAVITNPALPSATSQVQEGP